MAFMMESVCIRCREKFNYNAHSGKIETVCSPCITLEENRKADKHFSELAKLTIEERIETIERWIYYYKPERSTRHERF